jgi:cystathionine beta-synthase
LITHVAMQVAREVDDPSALVVTFLCDTGERYLSKVFNDEWMRENQLLEPDRVTLGDLLAHKGEGAPADLVSAAPGQLVRQALGLMRLHDVSQLPVLENGACIGSVTEYALTQRGLESSRFLDAVVGEVMDEAFPVVDASQPVESVQKLLSKATPAVLVRREGTIDGIVTRSDMLAYLMTR